MIIETINFSVADLPCRLEECDHPTRLYACDELIGEYVTKGDEILCPLWDVSDDVLGSMKKEFFDTAKKWLDISGKCCSVGLTEELTLLFNDEKIVYWLMQTYSSIHKSNEYDYVDNQRFAEDGDKRSTDIYKKRRKTGCCGFYDEEFLCPINNKKYHIGFNYGH